MLFRSTAMIDCGISELRDSYISDLSDGERQKTMIAKALTQESDLIILDEPTSFLDIISRIEIIGLLRRLAKENMKTILLSSHDLEQSLISSDKLMLLSKTEGLVTGVPEDLIFNGQFNRLFSRNDICFDIKAGNFIHTSKEGRKVYITGEGILVKWMENLIARHGLVSCSTPDNAEFEIVINDGLNIIIKPTDRSSDNINSFNSFEQVNDYLKSYMG